jgi:hypothetical protein
MNAKTQIGGVACKQDVNERTRQVLVREGSDVLGGEPC